MDTSILGIYSFTQQYFEVPLRGIGFTERKSLFKYIINKAKNLKQCKHLFKIVQCDCLNIELT